MSMIMCMSGNDAVRSYVYSALLRAVAQVGPVSDWYPPLEKNATGDVVFKQVRTMRGGYNNQGIVTDGRAVWLRLVEQMREYVALHPALKQTLVDGDCAPELLDNFGGTTLPSMFRTAGDFQARAQSYADGLVRNYDWDVEQLQTFGDDELPHVDIFEDDGGRGSRETPWVLARYCAALIDKDDMIRAYDAAYASFQWPPNHPRGGADDSSPVHILKWLDDAQYEGVVTDEPPDDAYVAIVQRWLGVSAEGKRVVSVAPDMWIYREDGTRRRETVLGTPRSPSTFGTPVLFQVGTTWHFGCRASTQFVSAEGASPLSAPHTPVKWWQRPPPPRTERVVMRHDTDLLATWMLVEAQRGLDAWTGNDTTFDMDAVAPAGPGAQAAPRGIPAPPANLYDVRCWLGRKVWVVGGATSHAPPGPREFWATIINAFVGGPQGAQGAPPPTPNTVFGVEYVYLSSTGAQLKQYDYLTRADLAADSESTRDVAPGEVRPAAGYRSRVGYDFDSLVRIPFAAAGSGRIARAWEPPVYGKIVSIDTTTVTVDFGENYKKFHGTDRKFSRVQSKNAKLRLLAPEEEGPWLDAQVREKHNWFLMWTKLGNESFQKTRGWLLSGTLRQRYDHYSVFGVAKGMLWVHLPVLKAISELPRYKPVAGGVITLAEVVARMRGVLSAARRVFPGNLEAPNETNEQLDEMNEEDQINEDVEVKNAVSLSAFPHGSFMGWSKMTVGTKLDAWKTLSRSVALSRFSTSESNVQVQLDDADESAEQLAATTKALFDMWTPNVDGFYHVTQSSLLNNVQLASIYSGIGTMTHLRLACMALASPGQVGAQVQLDKYNQNVMVFAAADDPKPGTPYAASANGVSMDRECYNFCMAVDTSADYTLYTNAIYTRFIANGLNGNAPDAQDMLPMLFEKMNNEPYRASIVAVELPLFNPFLMSSKAVSAKRCFLLQTQADFVVQMSRIGTNTDRTQDKGPIVMGEYKTIMENNSPRASVLSKRNIKQVVTNAHLFRAMTGISVDYGVIFIATRRPNKTVYALLFSLQDIPVELERATLLAPVGENNDVLYVDKNTFACFRGGVPTSIDAWFPNFQVWNNNPAPAMPTGSWRENALKDSADDRPAAAGYNRTKRLVIDGYKAVAFTGVAGPVAGNDINFAVYTRTTPITVFDVAPHTAYIYNGIVPPPPGPAADEEVEEDDEGAAPFVGAGPVGLARRQKNPDEQHADLRMKLFQAVRDEASTIWEEADRDALGLQDTPYDTHSVNNLFNMLKQFSFADDPACLKKPAGWAEEAQGQGRFASILLKLQPGAAARTPVGRMDTAFLNRPALRYDPQDRDLDDRDVLSILIRTLNRLVNESVQRRFVLPKTSVGALDEPVHPSNTGVTRGDAARRFLHLSQRAFWSKDMFDYALAIYKVEAKKLRAKLE